MSRLAEALSWLVEPRPTEPCPSASQPPDHPTDRSFAVPADKTTGGSAFPARPIVAVIGLTPGCGATTVARALAAALARRDHSGAAIVVARVEPAGSALAVPAASRLAKRLNASARGRLCITHADPSPELARLAPLVLDVSHGAAPSLPADLTILVVPGDAEPALTELAARALGNPLTVVTRAADPDRWQARAFAHLPHSRSAAWLAAAGWDPRGAFGAAIAQIGDACEEAACA